MINPTGTWRVLAERLGSEDNPLFRTQLETVITHMKCEAEKDLDGILATLAPNARYKIFTGEDVPLVLDGIEAIKAGFYLASMKTTSYGELSVDSLVVDKGCLVTIGSSKLAVPGSALIDMGVTADEPDAFYLRNIHGLVVEWPFIEDGSLLLGENVYFGGSDPYEVVAQQKLNPEDIVRGVHA